MRPSLPFAHHLACLVRCVCVGGGDGEIKAARPSSVSGTVPNRLLVTQLYLLSTKTRERWCLWRRRSPVFVFSDAKTLTGPNRAAEPLQYCRVALGLPNDSFLWVRSHGAFRENLHLQQRGPFYVTVGLNSTQLNFIVKHGLHTGHMTWMKFQSSQSHIVQTLMCFQSVSEKNPPFASLQHPTQPGVGSALCAPTKSVFGGGRRL